MSGGDIDSGMIEFAARVLWADGQRRLKQGVSDLPRTRTDFRAAASDLFSHPALAALTAPPARTYAEGVAMACAHFEQAIGDGYPLPAEKTTQCAHGQFGWEDCIACYDDALIAKIAAIRLLSQGEKA